MSTERQDTQEPQEPQKTGEAGPDQPVRVEGSSLGPEEMAALTAVLAQLSAEEAAVGTQSRRTRSGRPDRTLLRRGDLGLWARPGRGEWRRAGGWR
ncbi:acyl-CoA carboxylase subunit epsilon [Micrococcus sp.]|uniref:acyl-CoA carboxylase subunit epsilon n=1 Tax=Micrococcus sp. TaxID=1271 RepID=UPI002A917B01|nr:acyl-CoA carboxylase subunit epsilon [Micrococcus sp.]MDY6054838.1 acyl-CoA carboxylase subunit epsilon [Micrococcus sp.]